MELVINDFHIFLKQVNVHTDVNVMLEFRVNFNGLGSPWIYLVKILKVTI